jgi:hypothetical protein
MMFRQDRCATKGLETGATPPVVLPPNEYWTTGFSPDKAQLSKHCRGLPPRMLFDQNFKTRTAWLPKRFVRAAALLRPPTVAMKAQRVKVDRLLLVFCRR